MSEYKLTVKLEQYTPLLHFQGNQHGACLRATEVKPKLDRFIIGYLENQGIEFIPAEWKMDTPSGQNHTALKYKMSFRRNGVNVLKNSQGFLKSHPLDFISGMEETPSHVGVFYKNGVEMTILSLINPHCSLNNPVPLPSGGETDSFFELINALLPYFFALHTFGARSNKGFGSFGVKGERIPFESLCKSLPPDTHGIFYLKREEAPSFDLAVENKALTSLMKMTHEHYLDDIFVISAIMKGGINYPRQKTYLKGEIQRLWSVDKKIGTEKAYLKAKAFSVAQKKLYQDSICGGNDRTSYVSYGKYQFERAMLGLSDHYQFGLGKKDNSNVIYYDVQYNDMGTKIERFENPVRFHPFSNGVYVIVKKIPDVLFDKEFKFVLYRGKSHPIHTPDAFDLWGFVENVLVHFKPGSSLPTDWNDLRRMSCLFYNPGKDRDGNSKPDITGQKRTCHFQDTWDNLRLIDVWRNEAHE